MMREVVYYQNATKFTLHIHAPLHAAESLQRLANGLGANSPGLRYNNGCESVQHIVPTGSRQHKFAKALAVMRYCEAHAFFLNRDIARSPIVAFGKSICLHLAERFLRCTPQSGPRLRGITPDNRP